MDSSAVDMLFRAGAAALERQLRRQYPTIAEAASDAVQHSFSQLSISDVPMREPMRWVARAANNFMIDQLRRGRRQQLVGSAVQFEQWLPSVSPLDADEAAEQEWRAAALHRALQQIDEPMHTALIMMYMNGSSYREIAQCTGLAVASVGTILLRARKRLRTLVESELSQPRQLQLVRA